MDNKFKKVETENNETLQTKDPVISKDVLREYVGVQEKERSSNFKDRLDFYFEQAKEYLTNNVTLQEFKYFWTLPRIGVVLGVIVVIFVLLYTFALVDIQNTKSSSQYRLVPEKISKSANIRISLPANVDIEEIEKIVNFHPSIKGQWMKESGSFLNKYVFAESGDQIIYFNPDEDLLLDRYYQVSLNLGELKSMKADFLVVENPKVEAVFPKGDGEAMEDSDIMIVFNRPMINFNDGRIVFEDNPPLEIIPRVNGIYSWISPNVLRLELKEDMIPSMKYMVKIKKGFVSLDELEIPEAEFSFMTRKVNYVGLDYHKKEVIHNQPLRLYFNQDVDVEKTASQLSLYEDGKKIPFIVSYAKKDSGTSVVSEVIDYFANAVSVGDYSVNSNDIDKDKSILEVYSKELNWKTGKQYSLISEKIFPSKGDVALEEKKEIFFTALDVVKNISTYSDRTNYSSLDLFDPQGYVLLEFYENIDLSKTVIQSNATIRKIDYGEACSGASSTTSDCIKLTNRRLVRIYFNNNIKDVIRISIDDLYNDSGKKINSSTIEYKLKIYSPLWVSFGEDKINNNNKLILCSNNPLTVPREGYKNYIFSNDDYEIFSWGVSWKNDYYDNYCALGSFVTILEAGLIPENDYLFNVALEDVFGQKIDNKLTLNIGKSSEPQSLIIANGDEYNITTPDKVTLSFGAKNLETVIVEICKKYDAYSLYYRGYVKRDDLLDTCQQDIVRKEISLDMNRWINSYFNVDISDYFSEKIGNYVIKLSGKDSNDVYSFLTVSNLLAVEKRINLTDPNAEQDSDIFGEIKNMYWVNDMQTKKPIEGASVKIYSPGKIVEGFSNKEGLAFLTPIPDFEVAAVEYGRDSVVIANDNNLNVASDAFAINKSYIYTDKPIYHLGETVNVRGLLRRGYDGNYKIPKEEVKVSILNSKHEEIYQQVIPLDDLGIFTSFFEIDKNANFGEYSVCVEDYECGYFVVDDEDSAAFTAQINAKEGFISKEDIVLDINAFYDFGVPVENALVEYTISAQDFYFNKGLDGYYFMNEGNRNTKKITFLQGKTSLDIYGKGKIIENIDISQYFGEDSGSKKLTFDIVITSLFGQKLVERKEVILHRGAYYFGLSLSSNYLKVGKDLSIKLKTVNSEGVGVLTEDIDFEVFKIKWKKLEKTNSDGKKYYEWVKEKELTDSFIFKTSRDGGYVRTRKVNGGEGEYELYLTGKDIKNNVIITKHVFYVFGDGRTEVKEEDGTRLNLRTQNVNLNTSEIGKLIIESPYENARALISIERGRIFDYKIVDINNGIYEFDFKVEDEYFPNFYVSVLLLDFRGNARFSVKEFFVKSAVKNMNIILGINKSNYLPGEDAVLSIRTRKNNKTSVASKVSVLLYKQKELNRVNPFNYFYKEIPLVVATYVSVKTDGLAVEEYGKDMEVGHVARLNYIKSIIWNENIQVGIDRDYKFEFKTPSGSGDWRFEVLGIGGESYLGSAYIDFTTKKEVSVEPIRPNFVIPGDMFYVGVEVFNLTDKKKTVNASFESDTLIFLSENRDTLLNIEPRDSQKVYFSVNAPYDYLQGNHKFVINVDLQDSENIVRCSANKKTTSLKAKCGESDKKNFIEQPKEGFCNVGIVTDIVEKKDEWTWTCEGLNGGASALCRARKLKKSIDAKCGTAKNKKSVFAPSDKLCLTGNPSEVLGFGLWTWTCEGINGGKSISCSAPKDMAKLDAQCGKANGVAFSVKPTSDLCAYGQPTALTSFWSWSCLGANGGKSINCQAKKSNEGKNSCGSAHNQEFYLPPVNNLCNAGEPSRVIGEGPWTWTCGDARSFVEEEIIIREDNSYRNISIIGSTEDNTRDEVIFIPSKIVNEKGELSIRTSPNIVSFLANPLDYLVNYPYSSAEHIASRIRAMVLSGERLGFSSIFDKFKFSSLEKNSFYDSLDEEIENGVSVFRAHQNSDGGINQWGKGDSNFNVSLIALEVLNVLKKEKGLKYDFVDDLESYVYNNSFREEEKGNFEKIISAGYVLTMSDKYEKNVDIKNEIENIIKDEGLLQSLDSHLLLKLMIIIEGGGYSWGAGDKINKIIEKRIVEDARGLFLEASVNKHETSINNTALLLKSFVVKGKDNEKIDRVIQWLVNSKHKDGSWGSNKDTAEVIDALVCYLNWKKQTDSSYDLLIHLNDEQVDSFNFNSSTVLDQTNKKINIKNLNSNDYNLIHFDKSKHRPLFKDNLFYDISLKYYCEAGESPQDEGFTIYRNVYSLEDKKHETPLYSVGVDSILKIRLKIIAHQSSSDVMVEEFIPAGLEVVDIEVATKMNYLKSTSRETIVSYFYPDFVEVKEDRVLLFKDKLLPGVYDFDYYVRASTRGSFTYPSSIVSEMNNKNRFGKTGVFVFEVK